MLLSEEDKPVYDQISSQIIAYLKDRGNYDPAVDNGFVDIAVRALIRIRKLDDRLDVVGMEEAPAFIDAMQKMYGIFDKAVTGLAANRRERLKAKDRKDVDNELREAMHEFMGLK
jgi:uncharacterized protein (UPF0335 family)